MFPLHVGLDIVNLAVAITTVPTMVSHYGILHLLFSVLESA